MSEDAGTNGPIDVEEARQLVAKRDVRVIDIRSEDDFAEERLFGSVHADPDDVASTIDDLRDDGPDRVLLVCADGSQSAEVAEKLSGEGKEVTSLNGGFAAWTGEHLPTAPGRDEEYKGPEVKVPGAVASESGPDEDEDEEDGDEARAEGTADEDRAEPGRADEDEQVDAAADAEAAPGGGESSDRD